MNASDPWEMEVGIGPVFDKNTDWADVKRRIIAALGPEGVRREFTALGVHFEAPPNCTEKASCHAMDRPDERPSAFCNLATGIYHSRGEKIETLNLFDFALHYGKFGDWLGTIKHYAEMVRIEVHARKDRKSRIVEAAYDYTDENGEVLYQVIRYRLSNGKHDFRQQRPDGKGGWISGPGALDGVRRVLYRLGSIIDHPESTVFVVEGEKDADRLNSLFGETAIATTNSQGANDTARWETLRETLRGRMVVIIPDADGAGRKHARGIASYLNGVTASVKIVELPDVGPKGDVSDWLDQDHTIDDLWKLVVDAPIWDPTIPLPEPSPDRPPEQPNLSELGNAHRLIAAQGDHIRFSKPLGMWFIWDGTRWKPDETEEIYRLAKDTVRMIGHEAAEVTDSSRRTATLRWALQSEQKKVITAMIDLARSEPGIAIMPDALDCDPWLLNCPNGTVDLRTGKMREHRQNDLISKRTEVAFGGQCPQWLAALQTILAGDAELIAYVRRALGYSLTGTIGEHALFLCYGTGRNGKNTILDAVRTIMGDYATITNPRVFLADGQGDHPAALADLMGRRFVPTSEVEEGEKLAESLVKRVTGDRTLKARFMRQNPFEFSVLFKLWMLANCKPEIQGRDEGIWSRIRIIPFDVFIPPDKRIKNYSDILVAQEGPGILQWMVEGCLEWQQIGLAEPARVTEAVSHYRAEQDPFGDYLEQRCDQFDQGRVQVGKLYGDYMQWCKNNGEKSILTNRKFGAEMNRRGFKLWESNGARYRLGIALKRESDDTSDDFAFKDTAY